MAKTIRDCVDCLGADIESLLILLLEVDICHPRLDSVIILLSKNDELREWMWVVVRAAGLMLGTLEELSFLLTD